jgi:hypothetical protein
VKLIRRGIAAPVGLLLLAGCSGPAEHGIGPLTPPPCTAADCGTTVVKGPVLVGGIYNVEVVLHNYTGREIQLRSIRLLSPGGPGDIKVLNVRAYRLNQVGATSAIDEGDLAKTCPIIFNPWHPVTAVKIAPRSDANWLVYIALVFERPHITYHFGMARIDFVTGGATGWQNLQLPNLVLTTVPPGTPNVYYPDKCIVKKK